MVPSTHLLSGLAAAARFSLAFMLGALSYGCTGSVKQQGGVELRVFDAESPSFEVIAP